jgi:hypothetical protein
LLDTDGDGVCDIDEEVGCTDAQACNYNDQENLDHDVTLCIYSIDLDACATCSGDTDGTGTIIDNDEDNDGVCDDLEVEGCIQVNACNYNSEATEDDGSCVFAEPNYDCEGICLLDTDGDGVCDIYELPGCTDNAYLEYDVEATEDDGSCLTLVVFGCMDPLYIEFDENANTEDGSCTTLIIIGCMDEFACNYDANANQGNQEELCEYPEAYYDCNGECLADTDGDGICDELEVFGCTEEEACNYNADATEENGSCYYITVDLFYDYETPLTAVTLANNPTFTWFFNDVELDSINATIIPDENGLYEVVVTDDIGCEGATSITLEDVSSDELGNLEVAIYPNPVGDVLNVSIENYISTISIQILNTLGAEVISKTFENTNHDLQLVVNELPKGMYLLKINTELNL